MSRIFNVPVQLIEAPKLLTAALITNSLLTPTHWSPFQLIWKTWLQKLYKT